MYSNIKGKIKVKYKGHNITKDSLTEGELRIITSFFGINYLGLIINYLSNLFEFLSVLFQVLLFSTSLDFDISKEPPSSSLNS